MVKVDDVYQKVLMLANKEQRGYITPQEFNLFANMAQDEIIDQYFYELTTKDAISTDNTEYADMMEGIDEKISELKVTVPLALQSNDTPGVYIKPTDIYKVGMMETVTLPSSRATDFQDPITSSTVERVDRIEWKARHMSRLLLPTRTTAIYIDYNGLYTISPPPAKYAALSYVKVLPRINWTYVVVNESPMFNASSSLVQNCILHPSEENTLVYKILRLAGIGIQKQELVQYGKSMEASSDAKRLNK